MEWCRRYIAHLVTQSSLRVCGRSTFCRFGIQPRFEHMSHCARSLRHPRIPAARPHHQHGCRSDYGSSDCHRAIVSNTGRSRGRRRIFALFPYRYTATGIRQINGVDGQPACVYTHPWELDPNQPRVANGLISRVRTYTGLGGMRRKLARLLKDFEFSTMSAVHPVAASAPVTESRLTSTALSVQ